MDNSTHDLFNLLEEIERLETAAATHYKNACEEREQHEDATPLDAARIEYNLGLMTAYRTVATRLRANLGNEAARRAATADEIRNRLS